MTLYVLNTRARLNAAALSSLLSEQNIKVFAVPCLEIVYCLEQEELKRARDWLAEEADLAQRWLIFTSANAVSSLGKRLTRGALRDTPCKIAVVGEGTAQAVQRLGAEVAFVAKNYNAQSLAQELVEHFRDNRLKPRCLFLRGEKAKRDLPQIFGEESIALRELTAYRAAVPQLEPSELSDLREFLALSRQLPGKCVIVFTSAQAVRNFLVLCREQIREDAFKSVLRVVTMGQETTEVAKNHGMQVVAVAEENSLRALAAVVLQLRQSFAAE